MKITLIHNPTSGFGQHNAEELMALLRTQNYEPTYHSTGEDNWDKALENPGELVIVAGGDGTVDKVLTHSLGRSVPIGILPLGTANNIAHDIGADRPLHDVIASWKIGKTRKFNIGVAKGPWGKANFVESLGIGLFAQMMPILEALGKDQSHKSAADHMRFELENLISLIKACRTPTWEIKLDNKEVEGKYLMVEVMNITTVGPGLRLAPKANSGDDFLDVVLIEKDHCEDLENYLNLCLSTERPPATFPVRKAKQVELEWLGSTVHLDSSLWSSAEERPKGVKKPKKDPPYPIEVRLEAESIDVLVPDDK